MRRAISGRSTSPDPKRAKAGGGALVLVNLVRGSARTLDRQIYDGLRARILDGTLPPGARLPSSRSLSDDLRVSRSTVVRAFDQLGAEGYIEASGRGSTRVSRHLPDALTRAAAPSGAPRRGAAAPALSARARRIADAWPRFEVVTDRPARPFRTSAPALDVFPVEIWGRLMARRWRQASAASLGYSDPQGLRALRETIASYLTSARGVRCTPDQVLVTAGSQQALDLVARTVLTPGQAVWMEDPGYFGAAGALAAAGARIVPVPVDAEGLSVAEGIRRAPRATLAFVTPARQLPLGVTMSLRRRLQLLAWAAARGAWVLEDDYDSEFRYSTRPLSSLQGLDGHDSVIFVGTFSKVMLPSLRLGYVVAPERLVEPLVTVRRYADHCPPVLIQAVMADFMAAGHFERHIRRMRAIYQSRRLTLSALITRALGHLVEVDAPDAGMNLIAWLPKTMSDVAAARALAAAGIDAVPISSCTVRQRLRPGLLLGFSGVREPDLKLGVVTMKRVLESLATGS